MSDHTAARYETDDAYETGDGDAAGLPLRVMEMREAVQRLHAEIASLSERAAPVLMPDNPDPSAVGEIVCRPMSPVTSDLALLVYEIQRATLRVAEVTGRLDL